MKTLRQYYKVLVLGGYTNAVILCLVEPHESLTSIYEKLAFL